MSRMDVQPTAEPELIADVTLYATENGGRREPMLPGFGCPCVIDRNGPIEGWDALLLLGDQLMNPGETRRLGFVFLSGQKAVAPLRAAGRFYLWDGRFIGEAIVVENATPAISSDDAFLAADSGRGHTCKDARALLELNEMLAGRGAWIDIVETFEVKAGVEVPRIDLSIYGDHGSYDQPAEVRRELAAERVTKMLAAASKDADQLAFTVWLDRER